MCSSLAPVAPLCKVGICAPPVRGLSQPGVRFAECFCGLDFSPYSPHPWLGACTTVYGGQGWGAGPGMYSGL